MEHRWILAIAAVTLVAIPTLTLAQTRPDFSGTWRFNTAKSSRGTEGNTPGLTYPSVLVLKQTPDELSFRGVSLRQEDTKAMYKFDGSEVPVTSTPGITEKAKATWDGPKLVISTQKSFPSPAGGNFVTDIKEVWSLNGNVLSIVKTVTSDGVSETKTFIFDRSGS